jgi:thiamine-phosphate pyrophosphorylase
MKSDLIRGVYAITPERTSIWTPSAIINCVAAALEGGVRLFQCRQKNWDSAELTQFILRLNDLCEQFDAALILNDIPSRELNKYEGAAIVGAHLGKDDESIAQARGSLDEKWILGASCYNRLDLAQQAVRDGANYVAFGAMYPSFTKPDAVQASPSLFAQACVLGVPTVAIGGITLDDVPQLLKSGAHALAVLNGLFGEVPDMVQVRHMAEQWVNAVEQFGVPI